jgi:hypothetical protein
VNPTTPIPAHFPARSNQNAADLEIQSAALEKPCYCTFKATVPTVALSEPDLPVTVIA